MTVTPKKAPQTVRQDGTRVATLIDGVKIHSQVTQQDERGTLTELYSPYWRFDSIPLVFLYTVTVRPGKAKGWAVHHDQVDRYFFWGGTAKLVLFDDRPESPTYKLINELYFSEFNRSLVLVPPHIYHAVQNVGTTDVVMINLPSEPYHHDDPDKYTLPLENDLIPYTFKPESGH
ncbi:MAG TPA: dTDP-4-dehydrorhamnose 3,5-epimerase family protein [Aggregatilineales bacterium]|nr:dTDP-4-dehydrorhamnose 3,5-epimerase family protein [Anaerolineales bacterium]HRE49478.1 dTDP-4-dehydrorhamnose 3,5-epimerase family protein [Aggregatilineales bacterium]